MSYKNKQIKAVIFDLDGVIVSTDNCHYEAWKQLADKENIYFDRSINERLRGVSRMESLEIVLERTLKQYSFDEKIKLAESKNEYYKKLIHRLTPTDILPGVLLFIKLLKTNGIKIAIGSSSKNSPAILQRIELSGCFDATADGNDISKSKPDPEVFLVAAKRLYVEPVSCLVVEDSIAGIDAAVSAGMMSLAVGAASGYEKADISANSLLSISASDVLKSFIDIAAMS
jgi:beta-phosphoglucomutase